MYDIDNLGGVNTGIDNEAVVQAENIIEEYKRRFYSDEDVKQYIDVIQAIGEVAGAITYSRIEKDIKSDIENGNDDLESIISDGTKRTITSMLYNLKKHLPKEYWTACIEAFRQDFESK